MTLGRPANEVQSTLSTAFVRGTDTDIVLASGGGTNFPLTPQVVRLTNGDHWCLLVYSSKSGDTLTMASATDYALAQNVSLGDDSYTWAIGSTVELVMAADHLDEIRDDIDYAISPMVVTGGAISEGTNAGTYKVAALTALLRTTDSETGPLAYVTLAEQDNQAITAADTTYFVVLSYNSGSPTISLSTTNPYAADKRNIPIGKVLKDSGDVVHFMSGGYNLQDGARKLHERAMTLRTLELNGGATIAYSGTNNFTMTEGIAFGGINKFVLPSYNSATTTFRPIYTGFVEGNELSGTDIAFVDGGAGKDTITRTAADFIANGYVAGDILTVAGSASNDGDYPIVSVAAGTINVATGSLTGEGAGASVTLTVAKKKIDFAHYDNAGTLADVGTAKFGCHWIYRHIGDGDVYVRYGTISGSLAECEAALEPTKPDHLTDFGVLIGKIIAPQAGGSFAAIQQVSETFFTGTAVSDHNQLGNLQGGALDEYYHLTSAEHAKAAQAVAADGSVPLTDDWDVGGHSLNNVLSLGFSDGADVVTGTVADTTIYVDYTNGNDTTGDGSSGSPYKTIEKAIDVLRDLSKHVVAIAVSGGSVLASTLTFAGKLNINSIVLKAMNTSDEELYTYGTAGAGSSTTITLAGGTSWATDFWKDAYIFIWHGTGVGQIRQITASTNADPCVCTVAAWDTNPDNTSDYTIVGETIDCGANGEGLAGLPANLSIYGFRWINATSVAITTYPDSGKNTQRFGLSINQNLFDTGSGGLRIAGFELSGARNLFRVSSGSGIEVRENALVNAPQNCYISASAGSYTGLYVFRNSFVRLYSGATASTFIGFNEGIKAQYGSYVEGGSSSVFTNCTTDYTPTASGTPDYSVVA
ncbi:MAG: hypothetical protein JRD89_06015 [Deltaproteobacteria bacterium]|nr:hypothetical protein [Deltaproteobacteria bacterium]